VEGVHDLHVWTITSGFESLSVHAQVAGRDRDETLSEVREMVRERFGIAHSTIQIEEGECGEEGRCD
jgi:cobalt-zinc-cadmium efflux system protein